LIPGTVHRWGCNHITAICPDIDIQFLSDIVSNFKIRIQALNKYGIFLMLISLVFCESTTGGYWRKRFVIFMNTVPTLSIWKDFSKPEVNNKPRSMSLLLPFFL
jgi:hypothetical protein